MQVLTTTAVAQKALAAATVKVYRHRSRHMVDFITVESGPGSVRVSATNLETFAAIDLPASGEETWKVSVDATMFRDAVKISGDLTYTGESLIVGGMTLPALEDMPELEWGPPEYAGTFHGDPAFLHRATSSDQGRPILTGVHIGVDGWFDGLEAVATDSYRLHHAHYGGEWYGDPVLAPRAWFAELKRILGGDVTISRITCNNVDWIQGQSDAGIVSARVIDGTFPNWRNLIDGHEEHGSITVDAKQFGALVTAAGKIDKDKPVRLTVGDVLTVSSKSGEATYSATMPIQGQWHGYKDEPAIAFSPSYLVGTLPKTGEATILFDESALKPAIVKSELGMALLMPVRL